MPRYHLIILLIIGLFLPACISTPRGPKIVDGGVHFILNAPQAKSVSIAGTFNRWNCNKNQLANPDKKGIWSTFLNLPPGYYEYIFIIDEKIRLPDPGAPTIDDGMGGENSLLIIE